MARLSAGLLVFRRREGRLEVLVAHMGGPLWARREAGAWTIPKGEVADGEDPLATAIREFREETGHEPPGDPTWDLGEVRQRGGKRVRVFAREGDLDPACIASNTFTMEWPPRSGRMAEFPEVDRAEWVDARDPGDRLVSGQAEALAALVATLG